MNWKMKEIIFKYYIELGLITLTGIIILMYKKIFAIRFGVQALLRDRIVQAYNNYMDKGYCPIYVLENIEQLYTQYHTLGGNGTVTKLYEDLKELPTEKPKKKKKEIDT